MSEAASVLEAFLCCLKYLNNSQEFSKFNYIRQAIDSGSPEFQPGQTPEVYTSSYHIQASESPRVNRKQVLRQERPQSEEQGGQGVLPRSPASRASSRGLGRSTGLDPDCTPLCAGLSATTAPDHHPQYCLLWVCLGHKSGRSNFCLPQSYGSLGTMQTATRK